MSILRRKRLYLLIQTSEYYRPKNNEKLTFDKSFVLSPGPSAHYICVVFFIGIELRLRISLLFSLFFKLSTGLNGLLRLHDLFLLR